jgi:hypothetical protein
MSRDTVDEQIAGFAEHTPFLDLVLGLISAARRLDGLLARPGRAAPASASNPDSAIEFVLGLIAFRRKIGTTLATARPRQAPPKRRRRPAPRRFLR